MRRLFVASIAFTPLAAVGGQTVVSPTCDGAAVSEVLIQPGRPEFKGAMGLWRHAARAVGLHHATTSNGLIRRFVTLDPGVRCSEFRRAESERILRGQPFLSAATVQTIPDRDSARVEVSTVDEVPLVVAARMGRGTLRAFNLGTLNLLGAGLHLEGRWENGLALRNGWGGKLAHYQLFGKPYVVELEGARHPIGEALTATFGHPFLTDLQRGAWLSGLGISKDFVPLRRPDRSEILQPVSRAAWSAGGVVRIGPPRRLGLVGALVMGQRLIPASTFLLVDSITGLVAPTPATVGTKTFSVFDAISVAGVAGIRALSFSKMRGLDALEAEQDVGTGTQIGTVVGIQPRSSTPLSDGFASVDAYLGTRTARHFVAVRAKLESQFDFQHGTSQHVVESGRAAWYYAFGHWTSQLSLEGATVTKPMLPFQMALGDRDGGVRGYARSFEVGGRRVVGRIEQRYQIGRWRGERAAYGVEAFSDVGRMWAGDAPFGRDTPARVSVGAGLVAAVPARSQRTIHAGLAVPLRGKEGARPELRFSVREPMRGFWREPSRVRWMRLTPAAEQVFSWP